jgi:SH3-like domain-containing protein
MFFRKMKLTNLILLVTSLFFAACGDNSSLSTVQDSIEKTRQEFAPDKRIALFKAEAVMAGGELVVKGETNMPTAKAELMKQLQVAGIAVTDSLAVLPAPELEGKHFGIVNVSVCNIRSGPDHAEELSTQALLGASLRVWKEEGGFYLVQSPDDYFGWVDDGGFVRMDSSAYATWMASDRAVCLQDYVFAYAEKNEASLKVTDLLAGNMVQILENQGDFTKIRLPDGRTGFVKSGFLMPLNAWLDSRQPDEEHIIAAAKEMTGRPYLWGGTSGKGVDCSGFTKMAYFLNGIQLPRDASQQVHVGEAVETDTTFQNLQAGDLLFFGRKATADQKEKITHVAMYLGDGKIIHASDMVEVESLRRGDPSFVEYRLKSFVRSKRMIGQEGKNGVIRLKDSPFYGTQALRD